MLKERRGTSYEHCPNILTIVHRSSGGWTMGTITKLWYDGCELVPTLRLSEGEIVDLEIDRMGSIRAAVESLVGETALLRFVDACPV